MQTPQRIWARRGARRGSALVFVLVMTIALAALAMSAIALSSNATLLGKTFDREREYRYAAEAALAIGKSRINNDPQSVPLTGDTTLYNSLVLTDAENKPIRGVTVDVYAGPTGSTTGQSGRFVSVIAVAQDIQHRSRFVRRAELTQESFAKFAYWTDKESLSGSPIYFSNNDQLRGPVWSNDDIYIGSGTATFWNEVGTAGVINGLNYGIFKLSQPLQKQKPIQLPSTARLSFLPGYAASGNLSFNAGNSGAANAVTTRIEFVAVDLDGDGATTGTDEGFLRVYDANAGNTSWLRGDQGNDSCGDYHGPAGGPLKFYPISAHGAPWFRAALTALNDPAFNTVSKVNAHASTSAANTNAIMQRAGARCYLGGDPNLASIERAVGGVPANVGGEDLATFTPNGAKGKWRPWPGAIDLRLAGRPDATYLFPLHRSINPGSKSVIHVQGTAGVSGVVRGQLTLYASANIVLLDDTRYATPPQTNLCQDMLGLIAGRDIVVADNALNSMANYGGSWRVVDDSPDFNVHAVMMALSHSFTVENYDQAPFSASLCDGVTSGRGCLNLNGGIIQDARGIVAQNSASGFSGFTKRYSYDRCAIGHPPPYFPTTGRFIDNRYYEIDPAGLDVKSLFAQLSSK